MTSSSPVPPPTPALAPSSNQPSVSVPIAAARRQALQEKLAGTFTSVNARMVGLLKAGHAPLVDTMIRCGSSPYETLTLDHHAGPESFSLLGWALSTEIDDERGTTALERLRVAAVDMVKNRASATQAVVRWAQGEWLTPMLLGNDRRGVLCWSLNAQAQVLQQALPWVQPELLQQARLDTAYRDGTFDPTALTRAVHAKVMEDLLVLPAKTAVQRGIPCASAVLGPNAWTLTVSDPLPDSQPSWPELPLGWMAGVLHRWGVLAAWLKDQPVHTWLAPPPVALRQPTTMTRSVAPAGRLFRADGSPVRHLLDLVTTNLVHEGPGWSDQANHEPLTVLGHAVLAGEGREALRALWSDAELGTLADRMDRWAIAGSGVFIPEVARQPLATALERCRLDRAAVTDQPAIDRPRARL